jgi:hypothetical protein
MLYHGDFWVLIEFADSVGKTVFRYPSIRVDDEDVRSADERLVNDVRLPSEVKDAGRGLHSDVTRGPGATFRFLLGHREGCLVQVQFILLMPEILWATFCDMSIGPQLVHKLLHAER